MKSGILVINKEKNMTSRDVVNIACGKLKTKHIGHTGTLDPIATGVLVLGVNDGCKVIELLTSDTKIYKAEVVVGIETDSLDVTGNIINSYNIENLEEEKLKNIINSFKGKYMQEVPKYSAVHVNGKRLHEYARNNEDVILPKREVEIIDIEYLNDLRKEKDYYNFSFKVHVSKGTYIRSLIRDIGIKLGIPCTMKNLLREKQGIFSLEEAISIEEIDNKKLLKIEEALINYDSVIVDDITSKKVLNGMVLELDTNANLVLVFNKQKELLAIYKRYQKDPSKMKPYKVLGGKSEEIK